MRNHPTLALLVLILFLAPSPGSASEMVVIKYDVSGELLSGATPLGPIFGISAPGRAGVGSSVTFRFTPNQTGETAVDILSLVHSHGITDPHYTGYVLRVQQSSIVGGVLSSGVAVGTGTGSANEYARIHCLDSEGLPDCRRFVLRPHISIPLTNVRTGLPVWFAGGTLNYGRRGSGWIFNSSLGTFRADRPTHPLPGRGGKRTNLVGTEIGRTVIPVPEPGVLQFLSPIVLLVLLRRQGARR